MHVFPRFLPLRPWKPWLVAVALAGYVAHVAAAPLPLVLPALNLTSVQDAVLPQGENTPIDHFQHELVSLGDKVHWPPAAGAVERVRGLRAAGDARAWAVGAVGPAGRGSPTWGPGAAAPVGSAGGTAAAAAAAAGRATATGVPGARAASPALRAAEDGDAAGAGPREEVGTVLPNVTVSPAAPDAVRVPTFAWDAAVSETVAVANTSALFNSTAAGVAGNETLGEGASAEVVRWAPFLSEDFGAGLDARGWVALNQCEAGDWVCYSNATQNVHCAAHNLTLRPQQLDTPDGSNRTFRTGQVLRAFAVPQGATDLRVRVNVTLPTHPGAVPVLKVELGAANVISLYPSALLRSEEKLEAEPVGPGSDATRVLEVAVQLASGRVVFQDAPCTQLMLQRSSLNRADLFAGTLAFSVWVKPMTYVAEATQRAPNTTDLLRTNATLYVVNNTDPAWEMRLHEVELATQSA